MDSMVTFGRYDSGNIVCNVFLSSSCIISSDVQEKAVLRPEWDAAKTLSSSDLNKQNPESQRTDL